MAIVVSCECGRKLRASDEMAGKRARCPGCGASLRVPTPELPEPEPFVAQESNSYESSDSPDDPYAVKGEDRDNDYGEIPVADPPPPSPVSARALVGYSPPRVEVDVQPRSMSQTLADDHGVRRHLYWVMLLVLVPLVWSTLHTHADEGLLKDRIKETIKHHPEVMTALDTLPENASLDDVVAVLPGHRVEGALLGIDTWAHWAFAALSSAIFLGMVWALFPHGHAKLHKLALTGLFTGTAGIILLLGLQWAAFNMPLFTGRSLVTVLLDIVWLIGQSYKMALGQYGFVPSFLGFTAGVGFCEEAIKALPIIFIALKYGFSTWRSAMLWGLISGVGFGVSEGITYSTDYYNGISGIDAYLVRFVSCVGLHAIWAAAVGITIFRRQDIFREDMHVLEWILRVLQVVIVPMILHGLYDTLLKQQYDAWALGVSLLSFGWLAFQIERARRDFDTSPETMSAALA